MEPSNVDGICLAGWDRIELGHLSDGYPRAVLIVDSQLLTAPMESRIPPDPESDSDTRNSYLMFYWICANILLDLVGPIINVFTVQP